MSILLQSGEDEALVRALEGDLVEPAGVEVGGVERSVLDAVDTDEGLVEAERLERTLRERAHEGAGVVAEGPADEDDLADVAVGKEVEDGEAVRDDAQRDGRQALRGELNGGARSEEDGVALAHLRRGDLGDVALLVDVEELSLEVGGLADERATHRGVGGLGAAPEADDAPLLGELHEVAAHGHVRDAEDVGNLAHGDGAAGAAHLDDGVMSFVLQHLHAPRVCARSDRITHTYEHNRWASVRVSTKQPSESASGAVAGRIPYTALTQATLADENRPLGEVASPNRQIGLGWR